MEILDESPTVSEAKCHVSCYYILDDSYLYSMRIDHVISPTVENQLHPESETNSNIDCRICQSDSSVLQLFITVVHSYINIHTDPHI